MAYHDVTSGNGFFCGALGAMQAFITDATSADYAGYVAAAAAFAVEADSALNTLGVAGVNVSRGLLAETCAGVAFRNRNPLNVPSPSTAASYATVAAAVAALYAAAVGDLQ